MLLITIALVGVPILMLLTLVWDTLTVVHARTTRKKIIELDKKGNREEKAKRLQGHKRIYYVAIALTIAAVLAGASVLFASKTAARLGFIYVVPFSLMFVACAVWCYLLVWPKVGR